MSAIMHFDPAEVPFSRYGSYLAISRRADGVYLRSLHGDAPRSEVCRIDLLDAGRVIAEASVAATPSSLRMQCAGERGAAELEICFVAAKALRLRGSGLRLSFRAEGYDSAVAHADGWAINSYSNRLQCALIALAGNVTIERNGANLQADCAADASGLCDLLLIEFHSTWPGRDSDYCGDFADCKRAVDEEMQSWLQRMPSAPADYAAARALAAYVTWSSVVAAEGLFRRPAMLMSKNWLHRVWSWDHCFNAMALTYGNPELAWQQLLIPFDRQDRYGALPDAVDDKLAVWNFCKPPLHGWALLWMLQRSAAFEQRQLRALYRPLQRWTEWWLNRRSNADGLPQYFHGNDSGWDNCTVFDGGLPLVSADLAALLVIQMEALAELAQRLRKARAAARWRRRANDLLTLSLDSFWRGDRFAVRRAQSDGAEVADDPCGDSLFLLLPIVLGQRLPASLRAQLIAALRGSRFLTAHGLASESPASPYYSADGYWRGPIWAPATLLIAEGLRACGESALAGEIARRFCATVARSGMAENFDALSGAGLRDRAHTWTASVFLILAHEYLPR